jgi:DNA-binding transcriptional MerR regulator
MSTVQPTGPRFRIGAVSKTTGIPVSTLRIWETRYGAFSPVKTEGKQRLFEEQDVSKALLLKQLCSEGHAISAIASLDLAQLRRMSNLQHSMPPKLAKNDDPLCLAVVGLGMANRIESKKFTLSFNNQAIRITDIFSNLNQALSATFQTKTQILLIHTNSLDAGVQVDIHRLAKMNDSLQVIVLYNFGQEFIIESMKRSGMIVRREPISDSDLADLINSLRVVDTESSTAHLPSGTLIPARKYDDIELMRIAGISTEVLCECPRHVAEIITQLASFEQYSRDCLNKSTEDAHLHSYLSTVSGSARALFESALEMVAKHEGIDLRALSK